MLVVLSHAILSSFSSALLSEISYRVLRWFLLGVNLE
jgi:hypothetical protein